MPSPGNPNVPQQFRGPAPQQQRPQGPPTGPGAVRHASLPGMDQMQNRYASVPRPVGNSMPPGGNPMMLQQHQSQAPQGQQPNQPSATGEQIASCTWCT